MAFNNKTGIHFSANPIIIILSQREKSKSLVFWEKNPQKQYRYDSQMNLNIMIKIKFSNQSCKFQDYCFKQLEVFPFINILTQDNTETDYTL